jgi:hypothetical protein
MLDIECHNCRGPATSTLLYNTGKVYTRPFLEKNHHSCCSLCRSRGLVHSVQVEQRQLVSSCCDALNHWHNSLASSARFASTSTAATCTTAGPRSQWCRACAHLANRAEAEARQHKLGQVGKRAGLVEYPMVNAHHVTVVSNVATCKYEAAAGAAAAAAAAATI